MNAAKLAINIIQEAQKENESKAAELAKEHGCKIYTLVLLDEKGLPVVAFFKHPDRTTWGYFYDEYEKSPWNGYQLLFTNTLIKEASDPRIEVEDDMYVSAVMYCKDLSQYRMGDLKKN